MNKKQIEGLTNETIKMSRRLGAIKFTTLCETTRRYEAMQLASEAVAEKIHEQMRMSGERHWAAAGKSRKNALIVACKIAIRDSCKALENYIIINNGIEERINE